MKDLVEYNVIDADRDLLDAAVSDVEGVVNFSRAALVVQNSTKVYGRKVEHLYGLVLSSLKTFTLSRNDRTRSSLDSNEKGVQAADLKFREFDLSHNYLAREQVFPFATNVNMQSAQRCRRDSMGSRFSFASGRTYESFRTSFSNDQSMRQSSILNISDISLISAGTGVGDESQYGQGEEDGDAKKTHKKRRNQLTQLLQSALSHLVVMRNVCEVDSGSGFAMPGDTTGLTESETRNVMACTRLSLDTMVLPDSESLDSPHFEFGVVPDIQTVIFPQWNDNNADMLEKDDEHARPSSLDNSENDPRELWMGGSNDTMMEQEDLLSPRDDDYDYDFPGDEGSPGFVAADISPIPAENMGDNSPMKTDILTDRTSPPLASSSSHGATFVPREPDPWMLHDPHESMLTSSSSRPIRLGKTVKVPKSLRGQAVPEATECEPQEHPWRSIAAETFRHLTDPETHAEPGFSWTGHVYGSEFSEIIRRGQAHRTRETRQRIRTDHALQPNHDERMLHPIQAQDDENGDRDGNLGDFGDDGDGDYDDWDTGERGPVETNMGVASLDELYGHNYDDEETGAYNSPSVW